MVEKTDLIHLGELNTKKEIEYLIIKKKLWTLLIITLLFYAFVASAQSGAVYSFIFDVNPELTDFVKVDRNNKNWLSGFSVSKIFSEELINSIKIKTEEAFTKKLQMPVKMCFYRDKKGRIYDSVGNGGLLEGLPSNSFKGAKVSCTENNRYIRYSVKISNVGSTSVFLGKNKTKNKINTKPNLRIQATVFDGNKNKVWKKKIEIKDFSNLRSIKRYYGVFNVTKSEVLSNEDIYAMYIMGLEELMKE